MNPFEQKRTEESAIRPSLQDAVRGLLQPKTPGVLCDKGTIDPEGKSVFFVLLKKADLEKEALRILDEIQRTTDETQRAILIATYGAMQLGITQASSELDSLTLLDDDLNGRLTEYDSAVALEQASPEGMRNKAAIMRESLGFVEKSDHYQW